MAKKSIQAPAGAPVAGAEEPGVQAPPPERRFAAELHALRAEDPGRRPPGWLLSPQQVVRFIMGGGAAQ
ncbi:MAG: hypothetical protein RL071_4025, partial [Pseudomonadota bacterium]